MNAVILAVLALYTLPVSRAGDNANCANCSGPQSQANAAEKLLNYSAEALTSAYAGFSCVKLKPGQSSVLNQSDWESPTGVRHNYKLGRVGEKEYQATLNLKFTGDAAGGPENLGAQMRARIQRCLKVVNNALLGPMGEKLTIRLAESGDPAPPAPVVEIKIVEDDNARADSLNYPKRLISAKDSCPTLTHELLHLMGLVDEYEEKHIGYVLDTQTQKYNYADESDGPKAYDCRAKGPEDSIMNSHYQAFNEVFRGTEGYAERYTCQCPKSHRHCMKVLLSWPSDKCPNGSQETARGPVKETDSETRNQSRQVSSDSVEIVTGLSPNFRKKTLLYPGQFNALVHPGCSVNKDFYACAQNAYSTSTMNHGSGCKNASLPASCRDGKTDWTTGLVQ